jgi:hypothetical protein
MMNLSALHSFQSQLDKLSTDRHHKAGSSCETGLRLCQEALSQSPPDSEKLKQAVKLLLNAIQQHRLNPEPYQAVAIICILLERWQQAIKVVRALLAISPQDAGAQALMQYIHTAMNGGIPETNAFEEPSENLDADIHQLLHAIFKVEKAIKAPEMNSASFALLKIEFAHVHQSQQNITAQIGRLESYTDTTPLHFRMKPILEKISRCEQDIQVYTSLFQCQQQVTQLQKEVIRLYHQLNADENLSASTEHHLENILDACDHIADTLDAHEQNGFSIGWVEQPYTQLTLQIEQLQELLDKPRILVPAM